MSDQKVYLHRSMAPDVLIGHIEADGKVFESRLGPDKYIGRVDLENGNIYSSRLGPGEKVGRVDIETGKVYRALLGPDDYLGNVREDGQMFYHLPMARDLYVGKITAMRHISFGGAGFLLLVFPEVEDRFQADESNE
jgi:hypothetical protein